MEEVKFWTKGKIIALLIFIGIILSIVLAVYIHNRKLIKEYKRLENEFAIQTSNYLADEEITLEKGQWRKVDIKKLVENGWVNNRYSNDCTGYILATASKSTGAVNYKTYLKCKNIYKTSEENLSLAKGSENKSKTQSENDTTPPKITLLGKSTQTVKLNSEYKDKGATANDKVDGDLTSKIKVTNNVDTSIAGEYTVKYTVSDKRGNKASKTRKVIVKEDAEVETKDETKPVITFNSDTVQTICTGTTIDTSKGGVYGYIAYDDIDGDLSDKVSITGDTGAQSQVGTYTLNYSVKDKAGNEFSTQRQYNTKDCSAPAQVITQPQPQPRPTPTPIQPSGSSSSSSSSSSSGGTTPNTPQINNSKDVTSILLSPGSFTMGVGGVQNLTLTYQPSDATNKQPATYTSSNPSVASVDSNGTVRGISAGTARITASANGKSASSTVYVK